MTAALVRDTKYVIRNTFLKLLAVFLLTTCYLLLATNSAFAQSPSTPSAISSQPSATNYELRTTNFSPQSPHTASLAIYNFSHAMSCILIGQSPIAPCLEYKMYKDATGMVRSVPYLSSTNTSNGVLGMSLSMIGEVISTPPVRSSEFIANLGEQIGIKSAHAQVGGSGSGVLAPIFKLWEVSRNIAYLVMILIFVFVGLMVMFRQKLNPQTVVSIQLALPGLVIGLVMITFSYFLASLISDLAFVGTNVVGYYFSLAQVSTTVTRPPLINPSGGEENVITVFSRHLGLVDTGPVHSVVSNIWGLLPGGTQFLLTIASGFVVGQFTNNLSQMATIIPEWWGKAIQIGANLIVGTAGGLAGAWTTALVITWIAWFVLIYSMIRLLLKLINNLLSIIFLTITAPFFFLAASIPGRQNIATTWMFNMLCNVLVFPAIVALFYFVIYITGSSDPAFATSGTTTSLTQVTTFPLLGGIDLKVINMLIGFGALVASPSIPDVICRTIGKPGQLGGIVSGAISGGITGGQKYYGQTTQASTGAFRTGASARQLFSTPSYEAVIDSNTGQVTGVSKSRYSFQPGVFKKLGYGLTGTSLGENIRNRYPRLARGLGVMEKKGSNQDATPAGAVQEPAVRRSA